MLESSKYLEYFTPIVNGNGGLKRYNAKSLGNSIVCNDDLDLIDLI